MVLRADECLPLQDTSIVSVVYAGRTVVANTPKSYVLQCLSTGRTTWGYPIPHLTHGFLGPDDSTTQTVSRSFSFGSRSLSTDTDVSTCLVPRTLSSYGDRTFAAVGPRLWNSLPVQLRNPDITNGLCRRQLKRHVFGKHEHGALRHMICSAIGKHFLTYLQTHTHTNHATFALSCDAA